MSNILAEIIPQVNEITATITQNGVTVSAIIEKSNREITATMQHGLTAYDIAVNNGFVGTEVEWLASYAQGNDGLSAYELAVENGFVGTEAEWLTSLQGAPGQDGSDGIIGYNGASAYEIAVANGFVGTEDAWLLSLQGAPGNNGATGATGENGIDGIDGSNGTNGADGADGLSAYTIAVNNGFIGTEAEWLLSLQGPAGSDGDAGADGEDGISAYQVALNNGFVGTQAEWLLSLVGDPGEDGTNGSAGINGTNGTNGTNGVDGTDGADGISAYQVAVNNGFVGDEVAWLASLQGADGVDGTNGTNGADGAPGTSGLTANLQQVLTNGSQADKPITILYEDITAQNDTYSKHAVLSSSGTSGRLILKSDTGLRGNLHADNIDTTEKTIQLPNSNSTLATSIELSGVTYNTNSSGHIAVGNLFAPINNPEFTGNVGVGVTPTVKLHVLSTTEQLRLAYSASQYLAFTVSSVGSATIVPVGSTANMTIGAGNSMFFQQGGGTKVTVSAGGGALGVMRVEGTANGTNATGIGVTTSYAGSAANVSSSIGLIPTVSQTGLAGFRCFWISPWLNTQGSGVSDLIDAGTNSAAQGSGTHTSVFKVNTLGKITLNTTNTAAGTTGNQTINKPSGSVNIAAGGTTITVTNSLVTSASKLIVNVASNDATALFKNYVCGAGTFTITLNAAATAETKIDFIVFN